MIIEALRKLINKENLSKTEIKEVMSEITEGTATDAQIASFLTALRMKGETVDEITASVEFLKEKGEKLNLKNRDVIDIVGTGGDGSNTFNISTAVSFVVAAGGVRVAKHGSRASSSKSGAADILEVLGANIYLDAKQNEELLDKTNICFMFAPKFNPLMKSVYNVRREIKIRTVFNCLGPLINPSCAKTQMIGVYGKNLVEPVSLVMKNLNVQNGIVLFGECGLDEASVVSKTFYSRIVDNEIKTGEFSPADFGIKEAKIEDIKGGTPIENAEIMKGIFKGTIKGAKLDVVCLNAALAFLSAKKTDTVEKGLELSYSLIESGSVYKKLIQFIEGTNEYTR